MTEGFRGVLERRRRSSPGNLKIDGDVEARIIALACTDAPEGHDHWTVRLLADKAVELGYVESVCPATVANHLKKTRPGPGGEGVVRTRGVLRPRRGDGGRGRPPGPARPAVCPDESSRQLVAHSRGPLPARPGEPARRDHGYVRNGVADMLVAFALLLCERHARVTPTRAGGTWPRLCDGSRTTRACGQGAWSWSVTTRTRTPWGSPCEASLPGEVGRLVSRPEARHTPRHGSWLGMVETGAGCPVRHGLPARVADIDEAGRPARAWEDDRNARARTAGWKLAVGDARDRLARLYPKIVIAD